MSVWILTQQLSAEEQQAIASQTYLKLPFDELPDLSTIANPREFRFLLERLNPDAPPETIQLQLDRVWAQFAGLALDDVVVVPLPDIGEAAIGRISGRYHYHVGEGGKDIHTIPVSWYSKRYKLSSFGRDRQMIEKPYQPLQEVTDKEMREKILVKLPHSYNRFARWKWVIAAILMFKAALFLIHSLTQP